MPVITTLRSLLLRAVHTLLKKNILIDMINEDYCSFEVAKLLKEKEFDERSSASYDSKGELKEGYAYWNKTPIWYAAPTHQMAMKWLRDKKNILIYVYPVIDLPVKNDYTFHWRWDGKKKRYDAPHFGDEHNYESFEEAVEAALKYCLENLI